MTHHELETAVLALQSELKDLRRDAMEPVEQLAKEINALRQEDGRLLALLQRTFKHFSRRLNQMALNVTTLQANLATLKTDVDALVASHGTTEAQAQAVIDDAANQVAAVDATVKAATPPAA